jgi:acid phosphatase type 7
MNPERTQKMKKACLYLALCLFFIVSLSYSQRGNPEREPQRIILNLTEKPATSIAITWRTVAEVAAPEVAFAEPTDGSRFEKTAKNNPAKRVQFEADKLGAVYQYSVVLEGLRPGTHYVYKVGGDSVWSEWNQFTTAKETPTPFKFVWFGDPQDDIKEHVSRVFREAYRTAPDAAFWTFSGDMTTEPEDWRWGELFYAAGFIFRMTPSMMVPGNHDMGYKFENGKIARDARGRKERVKSISPMWRPQLTLPENGVPGLEETSYYVDYQGVRLIMINSNDRLDEQAAWMEKLLSQNPNIWTVVTFHHPLYSYGRERDDRGTRNAFATLFDKYHVDLVLTGHDHTYARSFKLYNGAVAADNGPGTLYVVSSSGPKYYVANPRYQSLMAKTAVDQSMFQVISVNGNKLEYKAYTAASTLFDSFELVK